jgi:class 3 adenylate cyclase
MADQVHILIVDDDAGIGEIIEKYLTLHGFSVANAETGAEAAPCGAGPPRDLLVFDIAAPGEDALALTRRLQERGNVGTVRIHTVLRHPSRHFASAREALRPARKITRKIAAIMAADVAFYSRLVADNEEGTLRLLAAYREIFDDFVDRYGGRVFNTAGDSVMSEFGSAVEAMRAAIDIQEALRTHNLAHPPERWLQFRIGITIADVVERQGELLGDGVNLAARLESLAAPGGICISRSVHEAVANKVSVLFRDLGEQTVKNIPTPIHAFVVDWPSSTADSN